MGVENEPGRNRVHRAIDIGADPLAQRESMEQHLGLKQCKSVRALKWQFVGGLPCWVDSHVGHNMCVSFHSFVGATKQGDDKQLGSGQIKLGPALDVASEATFPFTREEVRGGRRSVGGDSPEGGARIKKDPTFRAFLLPPQTFRWFLSLSVPCLALSLIFFAGPLNHDHHDKGGSGKLTETRNLFHCVGDEILPETSEEWNTS